MPLLASPLRLPEIGTKSVPIHTNDILDSPVMMTRSRFPLHVVVIATLCMLLCSCTEEPAMPSIVGINYSDRWVSTFRVNGHDAGNVAPHGGGGGFVCCIGVPRQWHSRLVAKVQWTEDERDPAKWREAVLPIPRYQRNATSLFAVHFYQDGTVKILVTNLGHLHPRYPLPDPTR